MSPGRNWGGGIWIWDPHEPSSLPFGCQSHKRRPSSPPAPLCEGARRGPQAASDTGHPGANHQSPVAGHHLLCSPNTQHPPTTSIDKPHRRKPARPATKKDLPSALRLYPAVSFASSSHFAPFPFCCFALVFPTNVDAPLHLRVAPTPSSTLNRLLAARRRSRKIRVLQETQSAGRFLGPISHSIQALPPTVSRVQEHVPLGLIPAPRSVFSTSASTLLVAGNNRNPSSSLCACRLDTNGQLSR